MKNIFLLLFPFWIFCADYDCIIIGTSPISLFEALHQKAIGKRVLILESDNCLGGAWRSIEACGVTQVDLGCHMIGENKELADFFEKFGGCPIVSLDFPTDPNAQMGKNGFYFAHGCHELIDHLAEQIQVQSIEVLFQHHVTAALVNEERNEVIVQTANRTFTAQKVILTPHTRICPENQEGYKKNFYHICLLIQDPTPPKFSYSWGIPNTVRMNNVTHFVGLQNTGKQLIILQTHDQETLKKGEAIVEQLKSKELIDPCAFLLCSQNYIYSQWISEKDPLHKKFPAYFELLDSNHLINMHRYIDKWKQSLAPYLENVLFK